MGGTLAGFAFPSSKEVWNTVCVFNVNECRLYFSSSLLSIVSVVLQCKLSKHYSEELQLSFFSLCLKFLPQLMA